MDTSLISNETWHSAEIKVKTDASGQVHLVLTTFGGTYQDYYVALKNVSVKQAYTYRHGIQTKIGDIEISVINYFME